MTAYHHLLFGRLAAGSSRRLVRTSVRASLACKQHLYGNQPHVQLLVPVTTRQGIVFEPMLRTAKSLWAPAATFGW
jgi:hypothetical protein